MRLPLQAKLASLLLIALSIQGCGGSSSSGAASATPTSSGATQTTATSSSSTVPPSGNTSQGPATVTLTSSFQKNSQLIIADMNPDRFEGFRRGDPVSIELVLKNDGKSLKDRSWTRADLSRVTLRSTSIDTGRQYSVTIAAAQMALNSGDSGGFATNGQGNLIRSDARWGVSPSNGVQILDSLGRELDNIQISGAAGLQTIDGVWITRNILFNPAMWSLD